MGTATHRSGIAIAGPSWWVDYWHAPILAAHPQVEVVAICGEQDRTDDEVRAKYGSAARYYRDYGRMLADARPNGVIVCTPNDIHAPLTLQAFEAGAGVLCEKPIAQNADEARSMAGAARSLRLVGMVNFPYRDNPAAAATRRFIAEGLIGVPLHISASYNGGFGLHNPPGWRGTVARSAGGILGDLGSHLIDLARWMLQREFKSVCAHNLTLYRSGADAPSPIRTEDPRAESRNDDSCAFLAEMEGGLQGIFHTSWTAAQGADTQAQVVDICGSAGRLRWTATHAGIQMDHLPAADAVWRPIILPGTKRPDTGSEYNEDWFRPGRLGTENTTYRWATAIASGNLAAQPDMNEGLQSQLVIDAILEASRERRWIDVADR